MKKNRILTESDIEYLAKRLEEKFITKDEFNKYKNDIFDKLDRILGEIVSTREEMIAISHRTSDHEDRLEDLEKIHPKGKHTS